VGAAVRVGDDIAQVIRVAGAAGGAAGESLDLVNSVREGCAFVGGKGAAIVKSEAPTRRA
jgi:hypothetical protein